MQSEQQSTETDGKTRTGFAILTAFIAWIILNILYRLLFSIFVDAYAAYDPSFGSGLGSFILIALAPSCLAAFGAVIVAVKIFKKANRQAVFYSFASLLVAMVVFLSLIELARSDFEGTVIVIIYLITLILSVLSARLALRMVSET